MPDPRWLLAKGPLALAVASSCAVSCASPPPQGEPLNLALPAVIAPPADDAGWRSGDAVLLQLDLEEPGETRTWYVKLSIPAGIPLLPSGRTLNLTTDGKESVIHSAALRVQAEVYDAAGQLIDRSDSQVSELLLRTGYVPYCERVLAVADVPEDLQVSEVTEEIVEAIVGMLSFPMLLTSVQENDSLSDLLWEVIEAPSLWSLIFSGGVIDLGIVTPDDGGVRRLEGAPNDASFEVGIHLTLQDELALVLRFEVLDSAPPLQLVAGVVAFEGSHPDEPGRVLRGRVVSAQRGAPPGWVTEYAAGGVTTVRMLDE